MPEDRLCSHCKAYRCRHDDAWCGNCGEPCAQLTMELLPAVLHVGEKPPRIAVRVRNGSCAQLKVRDIALPEWLEGTLEPDAQLAPGGDLRFFVSVKPRLESAVDGWIELRTASGSAREQLLVIHPKPRLICGAKDIPMWMEPGGQGNTGQVNLRPAEGSLRIVGVRATGVTAAVVIPLPPEGRVIGGGEDLIVELRPSPLPGGKAGPENFARVSVDYKGPHGTESAQADVRLTWQKPPQLKWAGRLDPTPVRLQAAGQRLRFELRNQSPDTDEGGLGNAPLLVEALDLHGHGLSEVSFKLVRESVALPFEIAGGDKKDVEFEADFGGLQGQPGRLVTLRLRVKTNLPAPEWDVPVRIEPMQVFGGVVAIDFGSSNSCCAMWQAGEEPSLVVLDEDDALVSPTVVRYLSLESVTPDIEAGARVQRLATEYAEVAASSADRLKQRLGDAAEQLSLRPERDGRWVERRASQAAADYLHWVRRKAESSRGYTFRSFILTHPARCSLRQFRRLREALVKAFGSVGKVRFVQEPIAALAEYFFERAKSGARSDYTIASFDLGGGTTDIALVHVHHEHSQLGRLVIRPSVRYCRGDLFGGEDLTDFLIEELTARCRDFLIAKSGMDAPTLICEGMLGATELDIRRNRATLRRVAEQFKASLSIEARGKGNHLAREIELRVLEQGKTGQVNVPMAAVSGPNRERGVLQTVFLEHTRSEVVKRAEMLRKAVHTTGLHPDVIQISGKTAYLPVVSEAVAVLFPGVSIERASQPKECVVRGACLLHGRRRGDTVVELNLDDQRMTSTIGAFSVDQLFFQGILAVDEVIPPEGATGELARVWDGQDSVVLWEDLDGTVRQISEMDAARDLQRLGTWAPVSTRAVAPGQEWTLRVRLLNYRLDVTAVGPDGEIVTFDPLHGSGE